MKFEQISTQLGKPYFETQDCLIYLGDCVELMRKIGEPAVDLTVTSPPYNIGKEYERSLPTDEYISWCEKWLAEIHSVTKIDGSFWLNLGYFDVPEKGKAVPIPYFLWDKSPFYLIQEIIWNYGAGVAGRKFFSPRNEKFLWYVKSQLQYTFNLDDVRDKNVKYPNQKKNGKIKVNPLGKNPGDVWYIPKVTSGTNRSSKERTPHPAQFPISLIDRIVKASSNKNDLIMDPFLGSGTTAVAALQNKRKFIGFEVVEKYCEISKKRILHYLEQQKQTSLFVGK